MKNRCLLLVGLVTASTINPMHTQNDTMRIEAATKNIFASAQMFLSAVMILPPKIKSIVSSLGPVVTEIEKQMEAFKSSDDVLLKIDAVASLFDQTAIAIELLIGSYIPQGATVDYGSHNFPGIVKDIAKIVTIGDADAGAKISQILPLIQDKVSYIDVIGKSLHEAVIDITQALKSRVNIIEQSQIIFNALNSLPIQINLITNTFNGVIAQFKADYEVLNGDGNLAAKVDAIADVVNQIAVVAELCVGSKLLPNNTVDLAHHSYVGVFNDFNNVLTSLDPETGLQLSTMLAIAHDKVGYIDMVAIALHKIATNLAKMAQQK